VKKVRLLSLATCALFTATFHSIPVEAKINDTTENAAKSNLIANDWWNPKHANPCSNWFTCAGTVLQGGQWIYENNKDSMFCGWGDNSPCQYSTPTVGNQDGDNSEYCDDEGRCTSRANSRY
jgi:hypothetical protein